MRPSIEQALLHLPDVIAEDHEGYIGWRAGTSTPPDRETWEDFITRTCGVIEEARLDPACQNLLVVCHGGVIRALLDHYLNLEPAHIIPVGPASLTSLRLSSDLVAPVRLELFNYSPNELQFDALIDTTTGGDSDESISELPELVLGACLNFFHR